MSLYAYVRPYDRGKYANHAPHVSRGLLSLANCVWMLRNAVQVGDWLVGLTSVKHYRDGARRISYIARVDEKITRKDYWRTYSHRRFDNYYEPVTTYPFFHQLPNPFHTTKDSDMGKDLKSKWIVLSRTFQDFGPDTDVRMPVLRGFQLNEFWNRVDLSLEASRCPRHYRKFPYDVVSLKNLELNWVGA